MPICPAYPGRSSRRVVPGRLAGLRRHLVEEEATGERGDLGGVVQGAGGPSYLRSVETPFSARARGCPQVQPGLPAELTRCRGSFLDLRIPRARAEAVRAKGFEVRERDNFQSKAGRLTGMRVPHDTDRLDEIVQLALEALRGG